MDEVLHILKDIAAAMGAISTIVGVIIACTKGGRNFVKNLFKKNTQDLHDENKQQNQNIEEIKIMVEEMTSMVESLKESAKFNHKNTIKNIYYAHCQDKRIPLHERKTADRAWELYNGEYEGNGEGKLMYDEICKWEIYASPNDLTED